MSRVAHVARLENAREYLGQFNVPEEVVVGAVTLKCSIDQYTEAHEEVERLNDVIIAEEQEFTDAQETYNRADLDELVSLGLITPDESSTLLKTAPAVWHLIFDKVAKVTEGTVVGASKFTDNFIKYNLAKQFPRRVVPVDGAVRDFFRTAEAISSRRRYLLVGTQRADQLAEIHELNQGRAGQIDTLLATTPDKLAILRAERSNNRIFGMYKILLAVDAFTFALTIPEVARDICGIKQETSGALLPALIVDAMTSDFGFDPIIENIEQAISKLSPELQGTVNVELTMNTIRVIALISEMITDEHVERLRLQTLHKSHRQELVSAKQDELNALADYIARLHGSLWTSVNERTNSGVSRERLLGALAVENILDDLMSSATTSVGLRFRRAGEEYRPGELHTRVNMLARMEQAELQSSRAQEIESTIESLVSRYEISSKKLRSHENGLALRKRLESLQESGTPVFTEDACRQIASLALFRSELPNLANDIAEIRNLWVELQGIKGKKAARTPLLARIDTLLELHETAPPKLINDENFAELWSLAEYLKNPELELADEPAADVEKETTEITAQEKVEKSLEIEPRAKVIDKEFAHRELIMAFPPGATEREIREDFEKIKKKYKRVSEEWERIESLVLLQLELRALGYSVSTHRLSNSNWHKLPHYAVEAVDAYNNRIVVVESPIFGNASYIIPNAEWREIVTETKEGAKILGAIPKVHVHGRSHSEHRQVLLESMNALFLRAKSTRRSVR
jgi:hypothetical protein